MSSGFVIRVPASSFEDIDGEPNHDGIYLDGLVPAMEAMEEPDEGSSSWDANPQLTETQTTLALCGLAHLEILNGGVEQLIYNGGRRALDVHAAFRRLGLEREAVSINEAVKLAWAVRSDQEEIVYVDDPILEQLQDSIALFLVSRLFYARMVEAMRADEVGYLIVPQDV